jgi:hypothetical protein
MQFFKDSLLLQDILLQDIKRSQFDAPDFLDFFINKLVLQRMLIEDRRFSDSLIEE